MKWKKLGLIFCPDKNYDWMLTHAANPVAEYLGNDHFRIYFSCRNEHNQASIGYVEIDINFPSKVIHIADKPVVSRGPVGSFADSGVSMGWLIEHMGKRYLYYLGWNLGVTVPFRNSIGLAIADGASNEFKSFSRAPIVDRNAVDPFCLSYPCVLKEDDCWKMWYGSNLGWGKEQSDMAHLIKYAESNDGINWQREDIISINFNSKDEYAICKPCVLKDNNIYKMWFSYRGKSYRIGYAESEDGKNWIRKDEEVGIDVSPDGWDSEMIEYPFVFDHKGQRYMLYNGNKYGETGFGMAVLIK